MQLSSVWITKQFIVYHFYVYFEDSTCMNKDSTDTVVLVCCRIRVLKKQFALAYAKKEAGLEPNLVV